jgi:hypothetical protein
MGGGFATGLYAVACASAGPMPARIGCLMGKIGLKTTQDVILDDKTGDDSSDN